MKTEITLLNSPQIFSSRFPISGRILTSNLVNDKRFDVHLTEHIQLKCYSKGFTRWKSLWNNEDNPLSGTDNYDVFARGWINAKISKFEWNSKFTLFYMYTGALDDVILQNIKTEVVFFTAYSILDLRMIKVLLNNRHKVVMGGASAFIYSPKEIREYLKKMNVANDLISKNLIIVTGYVDLTTDLYKIFDKWEDTVITKNDFTTMWDCTIDGFIDYIGIYRKLFDTHIGALLTSECWWGNCKFCTYNLLPKINFTDGVSVDKVFNYFCILRENYKSNNVFFNDSYILNTKFNKELLKKMSDDGFHISIFSGIKLMSNQKFLHFLNEIRINTICLGLESVNDFSLEYIQKGYGKKEINEMISQIKKYVKVPMTLYTFLITDLPMNSKNKETALSDIKRDWDFIVNFKKEVAKAGFHCEIAFSPLRHFPKTNLIDGNLLRYANEDQMNYESLSGLHGLYDYFNRKLGIDISQIVENKCINEAVVRYLPNGDFLESDIHHVDKEILRYSAKWE